MRRTQRAPPYLGRSGAAERLRESGRKRNEFGVQSGGSARCVVSVVVVAPRLAGKKCVVLLGLPLGLLDHIKHVGQSILSSDQAHGVDKRARLILDELRGSRRLVELAVVDPLNEQVVGLVDRLLRTQRESPEFHLQAITSYMGRGCSFIISREIMKGIVIGMGLGLYS
jgi:hypothetical protein